MKLYVYRVPGWRHSGKERILHRFSDVVDVNTKRFVKNEFCFFFNCLSNHLLTVYKTNLVYIFVKCLVCILVFSLKRISCEKKSEHFYTNIQHLNQCFWMEKVRVFTCCRRTSELQLPVPHHPHPVQ